MLLNTVKLYNNTSSTQVTSLKRLRVKFRSEAMLEATAYMFILKIITPPSTLQIHSFIEN